MVDTLKSENTPERGGNGPGRPCDYDPDLADAICRRMVAGESLDAITSDNDIPDLETITRWRAGHPDFAVAIAEAEQHLGQTSQFDKALLDKRLSATAR